MNALGNGGEWRSAAALEADIDALRGLDALGDFERVLGLMHIDADRLFAVDVLAGAYGGSMMEAMWWPHHYTALVQGVQTGHIEVGFVGAVHLVQEFSPELKRLLHLRPRTANQAP